MTITENKISYIAKLARLQLNPADVVHYQQDLNNILRLVEQMNALDTSNIPALTHPLETSLALRQDVVTAVDIRDQVLPLAMQVVDNFYLVPQVIGEES